MTGRPDPTTPYDARRPSDRGAIARLQSHGADLLPPRRVREAARRAALRASRRLSGALGEVREQNEELVEVVERQAAMIEQLERELDELRARLEER